MKKKPSGSLLSSWKWLRLRPAEGQQDAARSRASPPPAAPGPRGAPLGPPRPRPRQGYSPRAPVVTCCLPRCPHSHLAVPLLSNPPGDGPAVTDAPPAPVPPRPPALSPWQPGELGTARHRPPAVTPDQKQRGQQRPGPFTVILRGRRVLVLQHGVALRHREAALSGSHPAAPAPARVQVPSGQRPPAPGVSGG